jgi:hypothetical protein
MMFRWKEDVPLETWCFAGKMMFRWKHDVSLERRYFAGKMMFRWEDVYTIEDDERHGINCTLVLHKR